LGLDSPGTTPKY